MAAADHLVIFARYPERGKCKTRLARDLGEDLALRVYRRLLDHTLSMARACECRRSLRVTPDERAEGAAAWAPGMDAYQAQGDGDLGARLWRSVADAFAAGANKVCLIGTDCPQISPKSVRAAFDALESRPVVLGPARDGGYYLLGLKNPWPQLFAGIPWGTDKVLAETLNILKNHSLSYISLPELVDLDTYADFIALRDTEPLQNLGTN